MVRVEIAQLVFFAALCSLHVVAPTRKFFNNNLSGKAFHLCETKWISGQATRIKRKKIGFLFLLSIIVWRCDDQQSKDYADFPLYILIMGERPPADDLINEIIFDKKCGRKKEGREAFFKWCTGEREYVNNIRCSGLAGSSGQDCEVSASYYPGNGTNLKPPYYTDFKPKGIKVKIKCPNLANPDKAVDWPPIEAPFKNDDEFLKAAKYCRQELYGVDGLAWWVILLIILAVLLVLALAFYLFWKYFLRARYYKTNSNGLSQYTSAPFSATSEIEQQRPRSRSDGKKGAHRSTGSDRQSSQQRSLDPSTLKLVSTKRSTLAG